MTTRKEQVAAMRAEGKTFEQIGAALGVTRQRAHVIYLASQDQEPKPCPTCGGPTPRGFRYCSPPCWKNPPGPTGRPRGRPRKN